MSNQKMREALEHIIEYWNRDQNESAMADALFHIIETAEEALAQPAEAVGLPPRILKQGHFYNFKGQPERLVYLRPNTYWHQFALCSDPTRVWAEVHASDLHMIEETDCVTMEMMEAISALSRLLRAFEVAVGNKSPFALAAIEPARKVLAAHEAKKNGGA